MRAPKVNEKSLSTLIGSLRIHLNTKIHHLPQPEDGNGNIKCALHRFVSRSYKYKKNVMKYTTCSVPLCIHCYTVFHQTKNVSDIRKQVENVMEENNQCTAAREGGD